MTVCLGFLGNSVKLIKARNVLDPYPAKPINPFYGQYLAPVPGTSRTLKSRSRRIQIITKHDYLTR